MLAASRESYAAATDGLAELAAGAPPEQLAAAGVEILAVPDLLRREPRLRRAPAGASRGADERAGLLAAVLSGKIDDSALGLLTGLVRGRWSAPSELPRSVQPSAQGTLFARAAPAGELSDVEDELFRFGQV